MTLMDDDDDGGAKDSNETGDKTKDMIRWFKLSGMDGDWIEIRMKDEWMGGYMQDDRMENEMQF